MFSFAVSAVADARSMIFVHWPGMAAQNFFGFARPRENSTAPSKPTTTPAPAAIPHFQVNLIPIPVLHGCGYPRHGKLFLSAPHSKNGSALLNKLTIARMRMNVNIIFFHFFSDIHLPFDSLFCGFPHGNLNSCPVAAVVLKRRKSAENRVSADDPARGKVIFHGWDRAAG
ncbi:MAG: hypothetical protein LBS65_04435 [Desulfovibrio sp.]|jgi:hypothetical protein|nr:hypothetical protein [Desulfovibrio sp.]